MKYEDISTPKELYEFMNQNIRYGFHGIDEKNYTGENDREFQIACQTSWVLSDYKRVLKYGLGHCWDQVEFERDWFSKHNYEFKTIFIWFLFDYDNSYPTHTYLVYKENNKWYYFEHSDYDNRGIYEFDTYIEIIKYQMNKHIEKTKRNNVVDDKVLRHLHIYEFETPKYGINMIEYIDELMNNAEEITNEIIMIKDSELANE